MSDMTNKLGHTICTGKMNCPVKQSIFFIKVHTVHTQKAGYSWKEFKHFPMESVFHQP